MAQIAIDGWTPIPDDMAVEADLGDGWLARYELQANDGIPGVREIRIYGVPNARPGRPLSKTWLAKRLDPARAIEILKAHVASDDALLTIHGLTRDFIATEPDRPGRRGRGAWWWAAIALIYLGVLRNGSRSPVLDTSKMIGEHYGEHYVRDALRRARRKGLLTEPGHGRTDGQCITLKGIQALEEAEPFPVRMPPSAMDVGMIDERFLTPSAINWLRGRTSTQAREDA